MIPTRRLAMLAAALALVAVALNFAFPWGLLVINVPLVALALVDRHSAPDPDSVVVDRTAPSILTLGGNGCVTWTVHNPLARPVRCDVSDTLVDSLQPTLREFHLTVPSSGTATATTTIEPLRRGRFDFTEMTVRTYGVLGLVARQRDRRGASVNHTLRVMPPFRAKQEAELRIRKARITEVGVRSAQGRGGGTEFDQLREFTPDDEFRRIDWAATARSPRPIVRTYRAERNQNVALMLDTGRVMAAKVQGVSRFEHAIDAALMLTYVATQLGDRAGLITFGEKVRTVVPLSAQRQQTQRVTEALYALEPELVESDFRAAFSGAVAHFKRRAMLVVFTDLNLSSVIESIMPVLPLVARRNVIVIAAIQDPDVVAWASSSPATSEEVYRQAAAVAALDDRRKAAQLVGKYGVKVIDAPPGKIAHLLADQYLELKASGTL